MFDHNSINAANGGKSIDALAREHAARNAEILTCPFALTAAHKRTASAALDAPAPWDSGQSATRAAWDDLIDQLGMESHFANTRAHRDRAARFRDRLRKALDI